jgi:nitrogen regulatory protein PII
MTNEIIVLTDVSLITCIVPRGNGDQVVAAARAAGAQGAFIQYGRGAGIRERLGLFSITIEAEKEIIQIMVSKQQQDDIFAAIYRAAKLDVPGMGLMLVSPLDRAATYISPQIREKLACTGADND